MNIKQKIAAVWAALVLTAFAAAGCANNKPSEDVNDRVDNNIESEFESDKDDPSEEKDDEKEEDEKDGESEKEDKAENEAEDTDQNKKEDKTDDTKSDIKKEDKDEAKDNVKNDTKDEPAVDPSIDEQPEVPEVPAPGEGLPEDGTPSDDALGEEGTVVILPEKPKPETDTPADANALAGKTTAEIIEMIYENKSVDLFLDTLSIDVTDANSVKFYTGLSSADGIKEISVSEPMMGSQAYSLVLVRVGEGTDAASVAASMKEGINPAKWICVEADHVIAASSGDLALLFMVQTDLADTASTSDIFEAFKAVCGTAVEANG